MKDYIKEALVTDAEDYSPMAARSSEKHAVRILHAAMGLSTEAGEILDAMKKHIFYGKPIDLVNLKEEAGDIFWYLAVLCDELGITFGEAQETNIKKLRARFPNKFNEFDANNRDLSKEREILEMDT